MIAEQPRQQVYYIKKSNPWFISCLAIIFFILILLGLLLTETTSNMHKDISDMLAQFKKGTFNEEGKGSCNKLVYDQLLILQQQISSLERTLNETAWNSEETKCECSQQEQKQKQSKQSSWKEELAKFGKKFKEFINR